MLVLKCPKCKHNMRYQPLDGYVVGKSKRCVYCGRSFKVRDNIVRKE